VRGEDSALPTNDPRGWWGWTENKAPGREKQRGKGSDGRSKLPHRGSWGAIPASRALANLLTRATSHATLELFLSSVVHRRRGA